MAGETCEAKIGQWLEIECRGMLIPDQSENYMLLRSIFTFDLSTLDMMLSTPVNKQIGSMNSA